MAALNMKGGALQLALVMSFLWLAATDSTIQNVSSGRMMVNGFSLPSGEILTIRIGSDEATATIDIGHIKEITNVEIKNNKEYFVMDDQSGRTGILNGESVRAMDFVECKNIEVGF